MTTISSLNLWKSLGKNSYTKIRAEVVVSGDGTNSEWSLDFDNVISGCDTLYETLTDVRIYNINLYDGESISLTEL